MIAASTLRGDRRAGERPYGRGVLTRERAGAWLETVARDAGLPLPVRVASGLIDRLLGEPVHHYMEVGMSKGIKERV